MSNLTVVNNASIGVNCGGIFFYQYSSPVLWNCIVYGNTNDIPLEEPVQMWAWTYEECAPQFHNCLVQFGLDNISGYESIQVYENCLDEDPLFFDPDNEDFRIGSDSPCYNTGSSDTPAVVLEGHDLAGNPRVLNEGIDIGAYEVDLTGVQEHGQDKNALRIAGNPITAQSYAEIECESIGSLFAKVYSIDGKLVVDKNLGVIQKGNHRIALGDWFAPLPSGAYLIVVEAAGKTYAAKVIQ